MVEPLKPEFTIVIFIHYKPWIAVAILSLKWMKMTFSERQMKKIHNYTNTKLHNKNL